MWVIIVKLQNFNCTFHFWICSNNRNSCSSSSNNSNRQPLPMGRTWAVHPPTRPRRSSSVSGSCTSACIPMLSRHMQPPHSAARLRSGCSRCSPHTLSSSRRPLQQQLQQTVVISPRNQTAAVAATTIAAATTILVAIIVIRIVNSPLVLPSSRSCTHRTWSCASETMSSRSWSPKR